MTAKKDSIHRHAVPRGFVAAALALFLAGCINPQEKAAKDWCLAIRACQMIPIYPPSEDLVPGDVFLVQRPIGRQASEYKSRGYLSLDDHRVRLDGLDYKILYKDGYFADGFGKTPHPRALRGPVRLADEGGAGGSSGGGNGGSSVAPETIDVAAPRVFFPTYSFTVDRTQGLSLAFPIQGVPVALSFMGAQKAVGNVSIADARTYAADATELYARLEAWSRRPDVLSLLVGAAKASPKQVYLRVVKRVYLAGSLDVSIDNTSRLSGAGKAGMLSEQANDPAIGTADFQKTIEKQSKLLEALQAAASKQGIGGAVRFTEASDRTVALHESFDVPQVVGYLGMDVPVFEDGRLGLPLPTFERLEETLDQREPQALGELTRAQGDFVIRMRLLQLLGDKQDWPAVLRIVDKVGSGLEDEAMSALAERARAIASAPQGPTFAADSKVVLTKFRSGVSSYVAQDGGSGTRYAKVFDLLDSAILNK